MLVACVCVCLGEFNSFQLIPACEECEPDTARLVGGDKWESFQFLREQEAGATCVCQRQRGAAAGTNHPQVCGLKYVHAILPCYTSPRLAGCPAHVLRDLSVAGPGSRGSTGPVGLTAAGKCSGLEVMVFPAPAHWPEQATRPQPTTCRKAGLDVAQDQQHRQSRARPLITECLSLVTAP